MHQIDVLVIGGGNAGLCAALAARAGGASVLLVEKAAKAMRGGNSRHTRNLRCAHEQPDGTLIQQYSEQEYWQDLQRVTAGHTDAKLARMLIAESVAIREWMQQQGAQFQPALEGTLSLAHSNAFFLGGGRALLNSYYQQAERSDIKIWYQAAVQHLAIVDGRFQYALVQCQSDANEQPQPAAAQDVVRIEAKQLVVASGGFQANLDWLRQAWGPAAENFLIRGAASNTGEMLQQLQASGATTAGDAKACHAVAIDARAPRYDGGIISRLDCIPFGIVVNTKGQRFYDEGEDLWPKRYAIWGRLVAEQPDQLAFVIIDSQAVDDFMPSVYPPLQAPDLATLAQLLGLPLAALSTTVAQFNASIRPGQFAADRLDDCFTAGLQPPKSHWARPIAAPPYYAYPLRPGITFTYLGVAVDDTARVKFANSLPAAAAQPTNIFAAGEIMAGNILGQGYLAGIGMTIGSVFGRIAGREAARAARA